MMSRNSLESHYANRLASLKDKGISMMPSFKDLKFYGELLSEVKHYLNTEAKPYLQQQGIDPEQLNHPHELKQAFRNLPKEALRQEPCRKAFYNAICEIPVKLPMVVQSLNKAEQSSKSNPASIQSAMNTDFAEILARDFLHQQSQSILQVKTTDKTTEIDKIRREIESLEKQLQQKFQSLTHDGLSLNLHDQGMHNIGWEMNSVHNLAVLKQLSLKVKAKKKLSAPEEKFIQGERLALLAYLNYHGVDCNKINNFAQLVSHTKRIVDKDKDLNPNRKLYYQFVSDICLKMAKQG